MRSGNLGGPACAALVAARHLAALEAFAFGFGGVTTTSALLAALPRPAAGAA